MKPVNPYYSALTIVVLVLIAYVRVFNFDFISWDDTAYTVANNSVTSISFGHIKEWFTSFFIGNYHPLTMFSYALDYAIGGNQPAIFHTTNILLHAANAVLLWRLILLLSGDPLVALFTAILWALHPASVEATAWIAERKTLLSGTFSLAGLIYYTKYTGKPSTKTAIIIVGLGAAAMLSKATAVAFPLSLFAIDIWKGDRKLLKKGLSAKLPLLALALMIGITAVNAQQEGGFLHRHEVENPFMHLLYAGHAYASYILRILFPINLSVIYPYPTSGTLPAFFSLLTATVITAGIVAWKRNNYMLAGSIVFFSVNIIFLLQFISFGEALSADRYMYLASIGIIFPCINSIFTLFNNKKRPVAITISSLATTCLLLLTSFRAAAWQSDLTFFSALAETFPNSAVAHSSLGALYLQKDEMSLAEFHLDKATQLAPANYKAWHNKGNMYMKTGRTMEAFEAFTKSIEINGYTKSYFARAVIHQETGRFKLAIADIQRVLSHPPVDVRAWYLYGYCSEQTGHYSDAILAYSQAIRISGNNSLFYARRGVAESMIGKHNEAIADLKNAVNLPNPKPEYFYFLGNALFAASLNPCHDWTTAANAGDQRAITALQQHCK
ncbi:MAG: tetratricopeptide repeat protein [Chitinophagaceae bacterium]|nr:tetratricopeptide repeat protein [Chitinophagaceae bacterium]